MITTNSTDGGNNFNWIFGTSGNISFYLDYPGGNSHITNTNPTYRWKKATVTNNSAITKYELYIQPKDLITSTNIGTNLYIDNIVPNIGDNKQYAYYPTYTLYDDGSFFNLTPSNYLLTPGKYNFRVVAHDSAGNVREESVDFFVDAVNNPIGTNSQIYTNAQLDTNTQTGEPSNIETNNSNILPSPTPSTTPAGTFVALAARPAFDFKWRWILVLISIFFLFLFLLWKKKKKRQFKA